MMLGISNSKIGSRAQRTCCFRIMLLASGLVAVFLTMISERAHAQDPRTVLLNSGWDCCNKHDYNCAIRAASSCVAQFGRQAEHDQAQIAAGETSKPLQPGGADRNSPEARRTFANGVLNDVGACMFILGKSQEQTSLCADARRTYQDLAKLTYARVWDPQGWFWAPDEAAKDGLARLNGHC
jgi:hypothetical protein